MFQAFILGIVQGVTEFLPVSSSGHLVLIPAVLDWNSPALVFDATVHLATMLAVVLVFWKDIRDIIIAWFGQLKLGKPFATTESRLGWWIIIGTIPGVLAGLLLKDTFEDLFGNPRAAGAFLLVTAIVLVLAELLGKRKKNLDVLAGRFAYRDRAGGCHRSGDLSQRSNDNGRNAQGADTRIIRQVFLHPGTADYFWRLAGPVLRYHRARWFER